MARLSEAPPIIKVKIIDIGDWNMDLNSSKFVPHGLDYTKIRNITVVVRNDSDNAYEMSNKALNATTPEIRLWSYYNSVNVFAERATGSFLDSTSFDSTAYNRGWFTIEYVD